MAEHPKRHRFSTGLIVGVSTAVLLVGGVGSWWAWQQISTGEDPIAPPTEDPQAEPVPNERPTTEQPEPEPTVETQAVEVYWMQPTDTSFELQPTTISIAKTEPAEKVLAAAFEHLLSAESDPKYASEIPQATQLRSITLQDDGVRVDLSEDFTFGGGSLSMMGRLGQVVYTASSLDPDAKVWLEIEGRPLEYLGGEGIYVAQPMTRREFEENYPL